MDKEQYLIAQLDSRYIGDDGAVVGDQIFSADAFCEDVHFRRHWMDMYQIGRKAMLVNISDAVAMNARAKYALVTISIPNDLTQNDIDELLLGLEGAAKEWGCEIIGGDTVGGDKLHISVTLISQSNDPLYRKGLKEGDLLAFTGKLGESRASLIKLESGERIPSNSRFFEPKLRGDFVAKSRQFLSVGMDISDGLFCDTNKLLDLNSCGMEVTKNIDKETGLSGEEYEMLVGFDPKHLKDIEGIASLEGLDLTIFGKVVQNNFRFPCRSHHFEY